MYSQAVQPSAIEIQEHVPLAPYTTLRIGGPARYFCEVTTQGELLEAVAFARTQGLPIFTLGGGSNLLVSDKGFDGLVLHLAITAPIISIEDGAYLRYEVAAGVDWDYFVHHVCEQGIAGVECLAGIPGLVGGTPVQNVGAYGQEVAETIESVTALDLDTLAFVTLPHDACSFAYRRSIFNSTHRGRYIVTGVTFRLDPAARPRLTYADLQKHFAGAESPTPIQVYHAVRSIRRGKGMLLVEGDPDCQSAGSFFKNPVVSRAALEPIAQTLGIAEAFIPNWPVTEDTTKLPAAWLVERAGFHKGFSMGAAGISSRHTLALINRGGTTFAEIAALRDAIVAEVERRFFITLEQEPVQIGV